MDAKNNAKRRKLKPPVTLTGTAKEGCIGPSIGLIDIGTSVNAYIFRVALPGVRNNESKAQNFIYIRHWHVRCTVYVQKVY